jgi:hypothetical protein
MPMPMPMPMFPPNVQQFPIQPQHLGDGSAIDARPPNGTSNEHAPASENTGASTEHTDLQAEQPGEPQVRRAPLLPTFYAPSSSVEQLQAVQQQQQQFESMLSNMATQIESRAAAAQAAAHAAMHAAMQAIPNGIAPGPNTTFENNAMETRNGHDATPTEEAPARRPNPTSLPLWGSTIGEPALSPRSRESSEESSAAAPQMNGTHDHRDDDTAESSSSAQPKDRNPTVEDLLDDPD